MPAPASRQLSTAGARRETVLRTAISAFASRGYYGTTTVDVAKQAGISQPYIYRLFPDKEALFIAVVEYCFARIREAFAEGAAAAKGTSPAAVLDAIGDAYAHLIADRDLLMVQMHAQCAAASEPAVRQAVQTGYARLTEYARSVSGADEKELQQLFATGALCQLVVSIGAEQVDAPWARTLSNGIRHY